MPWKQDQPGCDCCGCGRVSDDFLADTISNYTQASGTWSIADGELSTSSDNAVLKSITTGVLYQQLATRFKSTGRKPVKLLGGMASGAVYVYAQVEFDADGNCGWLELRTKTAIGGSRIGERRRLENLDPDEWHELTLCIKPNSDLSEAAIYATADDACLYGELAQTPSVGAGLGTGSGGSDPVEFEYFTWNDSKSPDNECPECDCPCEGSRDDFERENSGSVPTGGDGIGCLWTVCANAWQISSGFLVGTGDADAQYLVPIDARAKSQYASVKARGGHGTRALLHMGYECDGSTLSAVVEFWSAPNKSRLAVSKDFGQTFENGWKYINVPQGGWVTLEACLKSGYFYASAAGARVRGSDTDAADAKFAGLGVRYHDNGATETGPRQPVFFDDFQIGKSGTPCGDCDSVQGGGGGVCSNCIDGVPRHLLVTQPALASAGCGSCAEHAGNYLLPQRVQDDGAEICCVWSTATTAGCPATASGGTASLCFDGTDYVLRYVLSGQFFSTITESHAWSVNLGADKPDCTTFDETLTLDTTAGGCSATGTTVVIKAA